jgi:hypothetical protein
MNNRFVMPVALGMFAFGVSLGLSPASAQTSPTKGGQAYADDLPTTRLIFACGGKPEMLKVALPNGHDSLSVLCDGNKVFNLESILAQERIVKLPGNAYEMLSGKPIELSFDCANVATETVDDVYNIRCNYKIPQSFFIKSVINFNIDIGGESLLPIPHYGGKIEFKSLHP